MNPSLNHVLMLQLDEAFRNQTQLRTHVHKNLDLSHIHGSNMYCSEESYAQFEYELHKTQKQNLCFIGGGNYHYISYFMLSRIRQDFSLVLFDNHTDSSPGMPILSCGSWVDWALRKLPRLKKVLIIGVQDSHASLISPDFSDLVQCIPHSQLSDTDLITKALSYLPTQACYLSIDKDVLLPQYASTNWDQGILSLDSLLYYISIVQSHSQILSADVCGEATHGESISYNNPQLQSPNEMVNLAIFNQLCSLKTHRESKPQSIFSLRNRRNNRSA
ncbi:MAG: hypothetical protein RIS47_430 [Bacteroidota bacterium]|jgi:arginase family enzyme